MKDYTKDYTEAIDYACRHLPKGYDLGLNLQDGSVYVVLTNDDGLYVDIPEVSPDLTIPEVIYEATEIARKLDQTALGKGEG